MGFYLRTVIYIRFHIPLRTMSKQYYGAGKPARTAADEDISAIDFVMTGLYTLMMRYVEQITEINRKRRVIQVQLGHQKRTTKQMNDLLRLQTQ